MKSVKKSNKKFAEKLASVPIEYQASVYAKEIKLQHQEKQIENKENLAKHRSLLKSLEKKFQEEKSEESRAILLNEIEIQKKIIKRAPRPKRKWSPILSGSFESNSRWRCVLKFRSNLPTLDGYSPCPLDFSIA
mgnify:FL=1